MEKKIHQGKNIARFRQMLGMKQDVLVTRLGGDWTQKKVSLLEAKDEIDEQLLNEVAKALNIPPDAIKNFDEDAAISIVANTFTDFKDNAVASAMNYYPTFNPVDKVIELFERMIKDKDEKIALLEKLLADKK